MWYVTCSMTEVHVVCDVLYDGRACAVWRAV